jgi:hypothetical protein
MLAFGLASCSASSICPRRRQIQKPIVAFYYSGHRIQYEGEDYIFAQDAKAGAEADPASGGVGLIALINTIVPDGSDAAGCSSSTPIASRRESRSRERCPTEPIRPSFLISRWMRLTGVLALIATHRLGRFQVFQP